MQDILICSILIERFVCITIYFESCPFASPWNERDVYDARVWHSSRASFERNSAICGGPNHSSMEVTIRERRYRAFDHVWNCDYRTGANWVTRVSAFRSKLWRVSAGFRCQHVVAIGRGVLRDLRTLTEFVVISRVLSSWRLSWSERQEGVEMGEARSGGVLACKWRAF